uniref:Uncharacterized protein n=1 Tax=Arundo donax TaxID=35708 RepID=A0A0A9BJF1_ARUDO
MHNVHCTKTIACLKKNHYTSGTIPENQMFLRLARHISPICPTLIPITR